jgi:pyocin large subunit-like protein
MLRPGDWLGLLLALAALWACGGAAAPPEQPPAQAPPAPAEKVPLPAAARTARQERTANSPGFPSKRSFDQHYQKHGAEFGRISQAEYLALAQALRDKPAAGAILEIVRKDGVATRFDRETGHFGAYNPDRTIRTFFIPNDGERYFQRQAWGAH